MERFSEILASRHFENTVQEYCLALGVFLAAYLGFYILRKVLATKVKRLTHSTSNNLDNFVMEILSSIHPSVFPLLSLYIASRKLTFPPRLDQTIGYIVGAALILQVTVFLTRFTTFLIHRVNFGENGDDLSLKNARQNLSILAKIFIWIGAGLFLLSNFGVDVTTFITGLGIGGLAIALAAQSILGDVFSSFTIAIDKPFSVGDFIVVDTFMGNVEYIGLKTTRIRSLGGELIILGNSDLTNARIKNFKKMDTRRINFKIGVVYGTSTDKLKRISEIVQSAIETTEKTVFDRVHFVEFGNSSLIFDIVYFVQSPAYVDYCSVQQQINFKISEAFEKDQIDMAFPTQTLHIASSNT